MSKLRLEDIDKNFAATNVDNVAFKFYDVTIEPFSVYGFAIAKQGEFLRMPRKTAETVNPGVYNLCENTSGGRIRFKTDSAHIAIRFVLPNLHIMKHMPLTGSSFFDLYVDGHYRKPFYPSNDFSDTATVRKEAREGLISHVDLEEKKMREIEINFPLYDCVSEVYIGLEEDAVVLPGRKYLNDKPVVFYGSSITQGGCASHPGNSYTNIISRRLNCDFINLGFSGSCKGEVEMANYIASLEMSAFVFDYDHNAPTAEHLYKTHGRFFEIIRKAHPKLPVIFVSAADSSFKDNVFDRKLAIFKTYFNALIEEKDDFVEFIGGDSIYEDVGIDYCTVDNCHPNDLGFWCMANSIGNALEKFIK